MNPTNQQIYHYLGIYRSNQSTDISLYGYNWLIFIIFYLTEFKVWNISDKLQVMSEFHEFSKDMPVIDKKEFII